MTTGPQPARLARYNRAVVLDLIRRFGPIARPELSERSGLAASSVMNVVVALEHSGLVRTVGQTTSKRGRPATVIELNPEARYALGVHVRVTGVEAVVLDMVGNTVANTALPLQGGSDPVSVIATVVEAVEQVVGLARIDLARVLGVGVACPGPVVNGTTVLAAPGFPQWCEVPLADHLEGRLGLPVTLENDANLGALAEYRSGAGVLVPECDPLVYIYADHGISAGMIVDGKLLRGSDGLAGQLGHTVIDLDGPQCACGDYGCLEVLASVRSIIRHTTVAARLGGITTVADQLAGDRNAVSYFAISDAVDAGDPLATAAVKEAVGCLAVGVTNVIRQLRPKLVVMGGQLFEYGDRELQCLCGILQGRPSFFGATPVPVVRNELGTRAPSIGAGLLVLDAFFGAPEQVISSEWIAQTPIPSFEQTPVWPLHAEQGALLVNSTARIREATNLRPLFCRVRAGDPVVVTLDVVFEGNAEQQASQTKALLHWDHVTRFLTPWPNPKNSPMHLVSTDGERATYSATLAALPPGVYEFTTIVLGANEVCAPGKGYPELNGRVQVVPTRAELIRLTRADEPSDRQAVATGAALDGRRNDREV